MILQLSLLIGHGWHWAVWHLRETKLDLCLRCSETAPSSGLFEYWRQYVVVSGNHTKYKFYILIWKCCLFELSPTTSAVVHCLIDSFYAGQREGQTWRLPGPPGSRGILVQPDPSDAVPTLWGEQTDGHHWVPGAGHRLPSCLQKTAQTAENEPPDQPHQQKCLLVLFLSLILILSLLLLPCFRLFFP